MTKKEFIKSIVDRYQYNDYTYEDLRERLLGALDGPSYCTLEAERLYAAHSGTYPNGFPYCPICGKEHNNENDN